MIFDKSIVPISHGLYTFEDIAYYYYSYETDLTIKEAEHLGTNVGTC